MVHRMTQPNPSARLTAAVTEKDPVSRLRLLEAIQAETAGLSESLRSARRDAIQELRSADATWREIGDILGVSAQRAEQLSR